MTRNAVGAVLVFVDELQKNTRTHLLEILRIFSSSEAQLAYEKAVPGFVNAKQELFCCWEGVYYPHSRTWFREAFSEEELEAMRNFDLAFWAAQKDGPRRWLLVSEYFKSLRGRQLMDAAIVALQSFESCTDNANSEDGRHGK